MPKPIQTLNTEDQSYPRKYVNKINKDLCVELESS